MRKVNQDVSIDSLKLRIPLNKVQILNDDITDTVLKVRKGSGEVLGEIKKNGVKILHEGITTHYALATIQERKGRFRDKNESIEYVVILFNSKILQERYFEGITRDNIETAYYRLMAHKVIHCSFDDFMSGFCTDVDLKQDVYITECDFSDILKKLAQRTVMSKKRNEGYRLEDKNDSKGIEWGKREWGTAARPFYKVYDKGLELQVNSTKFYYKYLNQDKEGEKYDTVNLIRREATMKDKKHFKRHGITDTSLKGLLNLSQDTLKPVLCKIHRLHIEKSLRTSKNSFSMVTPQKQVILNFMTALIEKDEVFEDVRFLALNGIECRRTKTRIKNEIDDLYEDYIKGSDSDMMSKELQKIMLFFENGVKP